MEPWGVQLLDLSEWGMFGLDLNSEPCAGSIFNHNKVGLCVYKNWLYVKSPDTWKPGVQFPEPIVASVTEGDLTFAGWHVVARRGPKDGIYVVAHSARYDNAAGFGDDAYVDRRLLVACGVYGRRPISEVYAEQLQDYDPEEHDFLGGIGVRGDDEPEYYVDVHDLEGELLERITVPEKIDFIGVESNELEFLHHVVEQIVSRDNAEEWVNVALSKLQWENGIPCLQANLYTQGQQHAATRTPMLFDQLRDLMEPGGY